MTKSERSHTVPADSLAWHDAGVYFIRNGENEQTWLWTVEVFRWDIEEDKDAQPGILTFESLKSYQAKHDLTKAELRGTVDWEILEAFFKRPAEELECHFLLQLFDKDNELGGHGYAEVTVTCRNAWFTPTD